MTNTYLNQREVNLLELLQTGCAAYSVNPKDTVALKSLQLKKLILVWRNSNWNKESFDVTYQSYGCYPNYVEDGKRYRIVE